MVADVIHAVQQTHVIRHPKPERTCELSPFEDKELPLPRTAVLYKVKWLIFAGLNHPTYEK